MLKTPAFSSPPNFWKTCLTLFSSSTFLTLPPSGSSTLRTMETVLTKANNKLRLGKVTGNFFMLYYIWTLPTDHFLFDGCFLSLTSSMSLSSGSWSSLLTPLPSAASWISVFSRFCSWLSFLPTLTLFLGKHIDSYGLNHYYKTSNHEFQIF